MRSKNAEIPLSNAKIEQGMRRSGFRHETLIYRDREEYLAATIPFLREGLASGEPVLVAVSRANAALLEAELGADSTAVRFADMEAVGRNPARIIPFWRDFLDEHAGVRVRAVGEPVWPGRSPAEIEECRRHEALLEPAFAGGRPWSLLCPYDVSVLDGGPLASGGGRLDHFAGELPNRPPTAAGFEFELADLAEVRRRVEESAEAVGISELDAAALVVAASELAANSVAHGGGAGVLRIWTEPGNLLIEIQDGGQIEEPLVGRVRPSATQRGGRGLWMANQLCDLVQIRSGEDGTTVRLQARRP
jgi:anti-sigma regulatory factor (Ser/Thr protein kinase)